MKVNIKLLNEQAKIPTYGSSFSAGADFYACLDREVVVLPNETVMIPTGVAMEIPDGYVGLVYARSGLALKMGLAPANKVGVIDSDYRGEIMVALYNHSDVERKVLPGERIAQIVITPYVKASFSVVSSLDDTKRGTGGFGSTGMK